MNSQEQFAAFEFMCRARAELAKNEMNYWLAEAEEWKQLRELPEPFIQGRVTPDTGYSEPIFDEILRCESAQDGSHGSSTNDFKG